MKKYVAAFIFITCFVLPGATAQKKPNALSLKKEKRLLKNVWIAMHHPMQHWPIPCLE